MNQVSATPEAPPPSRRSTIARTITVRGTILFAAGVSLMTVGLVLGDLIEPVASHLGMTGYMAAHGTIGQAAFLLFAFGFPLGMLVAAVGAALLGAGPPLRGAKVLLLGATAVFAAVLVPILFGRGTEGVYFGLGGITIMLGVLLVLWQWGQLRARTPAPLVPALDLAASALCFFALAAWNLCGAAAMPAFLLFPERSIEFGTRPFAVGQMKTVMALFVLGWLQLAVAAYVALKATTGPHSGSG